MSRHALFVCVEEFEDGGIVSGDKCAFLRERRAARLRRNVLHTGVFWAPPFC